MSHRRLLLFTLAFIAAIPVAYIATQVVAASRNIVFWDEFDTALDLILRINAGADWQELLQRFFALNNEHRMVTSRLMFAASYWLTGTVNFHVIGAIGNLFIVGACIVLVLAARSWERRARLGVVLAFLLFQLEHFENFIWSGASIDHFQVVMLGVAAIAALVAAGPQPAVADSAGAATEAVSGPPPGAGRLGSPFRGVSRAFLAAAALGALATFTLAHGNVVWPVGAMLLLYQRRWHELVPWCAVAVVVVAAFLHGFEFNPGHKITDLSLHGVPEVVRYWLALLGAPLTLGEAAFATLPGLGLLAGLGIVAARGALEREPVAMFSALFAVGALALIAVGRAELANGLINSRYMVLSALAWAMLIFILLEMEARSGKPFQMLAFLVPALAAFNVGANVKFRPMVEGFVEMRDRAATRFKQFGEDGRGIARLHPREQHADTLLRMAEERGVYQLPKFSFEEEFPDATQNPNIITYFDELLVNQRAVTLGGWAMLPDHVSDRGEVYVVLRSAKSLLFFSTITLQRPDVARVYNEPKWRLCGFRAVIGRTRLPAEDFDLGVLLDDGDAGEFLMTTNRLLLSTAQAARAVRSNP